MVKKTMSIIPRMNKKGVSPIIATLLLIVIAVAAAVVTYAFVTGFIGTSSGSATQTGAMSVDSVAADVSADQILVYVRNSGSKALDLTTPSVYIDGVAEAAANIAGGAALPVGSVITLTITPAATITAGQASQLRIVAADGTPVQVSFVPVP
jgi:flagellin-like protein